MESKSHSKNYITPEGYQHLSDRVQHLLATERPEIVKIVSWAAGNGDRSENGDYIYGKKRLRQIDQEIRKITKSLESAVVVEPHDENTEQIFFGCFVTIRDEDTEEVKTVRIVGVDEIDTKKNYISWRSPLAQALLKKRIDDQLLFKTPNGEQQILILDMSYHQKREAP